RSHANAAEPLSNGYRPYPPTNSVPIDHPSTDQKRIAPEAAASALPTAERALIDLVAERTGYPVEMLGLDLDMEADLGIDSIKRVEVLGDLQTLGYVPEGLDLDRLTHCRTLRQVVELLEPAPHHKATVGPWVGEIRTLIPGCELISTRLLDKRDDPVAEHHTLGGRKVSALDPDRKGLPVLPFTVMAEMLAQAAAVLRPDQVLKALRDVRANRWIRFEDEPVTLEIHARCDSERPDEVRVEVFNLGNAQTPKARSDGPVVDGIAVFGQGRADAPEPIEIDRESAGPCRFDAEELYRDQWLFHGPALQALIQVGPSSPAGIEGVLRVLPRRGLLRETDTGGLLTDAIILDSFTHLLGCWGLDQLREGDVMFPLRLAELTFYGDDPAEGSEVVCRIAIQDAERHRVRVDADLIGPSGQVWMRLKGWEDWRFYWPGRYRDVFRQPNTVLIGERLNLLDPALAAVWLEPPADMGRPVWRDVLEWTQLGPAERASITDNRCPDSLRSQRLWALIAAKEAVRRLWLDQGGAPVYPADLLIEHDSQDRPFIRSHLEPTRADLPKVSIAHADGVAVALAASDPKARVGIDVERIEARGANFESFTMSAAEQSFFDHLSSMSLSLPEWVSRVRTARRAAARATGLDDQESNFEVIDADVNTGMMLVQLSPPLAGSSFDPIHIPTVRRGEYIWAWAQAGRLEL
ncbi:MAG: phosphopantetheine-binding protein, partial [Isosphaeraceae bacterium]